MFHTTQRATDRPARGAYNERRTAEYVYQAATIAAALLLLLTAAIV